MLKSIPVWFLYPAGAAVLIATLAGTAFWFERGPGNAYAAWGGIRTNAAFPTGMVLVRGGAFVIGDEWPDALPDAPPRTVKLSAFHIDRQEVTNREFAAFVAATRFVTTAEQEGGGWVYRAGARDWQFVQGASWKHPLGPGSSIESADDHPVVLVSWYDAAAYAAWAGKRLPTEAEWEVAARAGVPASFQKRAVRSAPSSADANTWQGHWPNRNALEDGFFYTAPVGSFRPNALGLFDMLGNVWEWTADWYDGGEYRPATQAGASAPAGETLRVAKGGSWFCSPNYCGAYRPGFRGKSPPARAFNNVGFRCAADAVRQRP
jgi:sulfatase modifying factor 1